MSKRLIYSIVILLFISLSILIIGQVYNSAIPKLVEEINNSSIGAILTALVTVLLLKGQTVNELERDKDVKIFEEKIKVYSEFIEKLWSIADDKIVDQLEMKELRRICFSYLVFYLTDDQIKEISSHIIVICKNDQDDIIKSAGCITEILQKNLYKDKDFKGGNLQTLFNSFHHPILIPDEEESFEEKEVNVSINKDEHIIQTQKFENHTFWHFNLYDYNIQLKSFKANNWILNLIEYGEDWRTNLCKQIKEGDIIFAFRKGGNGYVGAFKALKVIVIEPGLNDTNENIKKYDIYNALEDGATLCTNIIVTPIAFNFKGVGYYSVRRRTIERINSLEAIKFLTDRFLGINLTEDKKLGMNKLDDNSELNQIDDSILIKIKNNL